MWKISYCACTNDVVKQQSDVLKRDFNDLLNTVSSLNAEVFISGPLPPVRRGVERFSRLLALNTWLSTACTVHSVHFIDNFNFFLGLFFKADGLCLNKSGVKLFIPNLFYFLRHPSVPSAKDKIQEESKQEEDTTQRGRNLEGELPQPPSEESFNHQREKESPPHSPTTTGLSEKSIRQLQLIQNSAACVLTKTKKVDHITPVLRVKMRHGEAGFSFYAPHIWNKLQVCCNS
ncbi:uncharacterized protein LOC122875043 [Siniperca chuatsi]|uniref:uncharacterized protein LOC122875043 n=1 Tax=Siniperca chuatsi TaxID=119488 RepID=UPI001CE0FB3B|nr:uncharacterized protein LOC122875043 [Siniperca chuatsi]